MLWSYEDEEMNVTGNSSDIKYDAEVMSDFTDALCHDMNSYRERARALERGYVKYHNNETFVGEMADVSKNFIYEVQGDMLHNRNLELKKEFLNMCLSIENMFKEEVDPSPKARVSVETLSNIKKDYNVCANVIDTKGYELDCHAKELVDALGKWGISTVPNYRRPMEAFDEFCGHGRFLDKSIKKLENFDQEACALIDRMDVKGFANDLQRNIIHKAGILDSMTVYQPNVAKNSVGLIGLSIGSIFPKTLFMNNKTKNVNIEEVDLKTFLESNGIIANKLETTDGYFILDKSIADIYKEAGVNQYLLDYKDYDDWYITGLVKDDGSVVYSMIKVREPMDEQARAGTSIVFESMSITAFKEIISDSTNGKHPKLDTVAQAQKEMEKISGADKHPLNYDKDLLNYYKDTKSEGSYLVADFIVTKVAHDDAFKDGVYKIPYEYEEFDIHGRLALFGLRGAGIYDPANNTITIKDPDHMTKDEKNAILLITTGDKDVYAYAGENQFHALAYESPEYFTKKHAIKSDAGVGEAEEHLFLKYEELFKNKNGTLYEQQYMYHKGDG